MKRKPYSKSLIILLIILCLGRTGAGAFTGSPGIKKPPKEEAVYARLLADGSVKNAYVVNSFELEEEGEFIDYGDYAEVTNLTTGNSLTINNRSVTIRAPEGKFFYQGKLKDPVLPWTVKISYFLDGVPVAPEKVPGSSGQLDISLDIADNPDAPKIFADNYALQITMAFDTELCSDLRAEGGTFALAGKNKVVNFMKLPGQNKGEYRVSLLAKDFEMEGIQISGVPLSLDFQIPDDNIAADLVQLEDAIKEINTGVGSISQGTSELKKGFDGFQTALENLHAGLEELEENYSLLVGSNKELSDASAMIANALEEIKNNLPSSENLAGSNLNELGEASGTFLQGTGGLAAGLAALEEGFNQADAAIQQQSGGTYAGLLQANQAVIASLEQKIGVLMADPPVGNADQIEELTALILILSANTQLLAGVRTGIAGNGSSNPGLADAAAELAAGYTQFDAAIQSLVSQLSETASGMAQLKTGIEGLADNYSQFHAGLETYLSGNLLIKEGVTALKDGLQKTAAGGNQLQEAVTSLDGGMKELAAGTGQLQKETGGMDQKMAAEIESYLSRYTGKDFEPLSFTAAENDNVTLVQFVMLTDALDLEEEAPEPPEAEELTFWQRFLALFSKFRTILKL